ncbi:hypothetical protein MKX08_003537 [Trichoderma sp. CBMAI-0020]|nr:hypothetical protein MKX08_003537 [Trichoderma sp. CBMAI-0020]
MFSSNSNVSQVCDHRNDTLPRLDLCRNMPASLDSHMAQAYNYLETVPNELLALIVDKVIKAPFDTSSALTNVRTISRIARTCKRLHSVANPILYSWSIQHGHCSGLFWAARKDRVDIFKRFLEGGASVNLVVSDRAPAMTAVLFQSVNIVRYMLTLPDVDWNRTNINNGMTPLHVAMVRPSKVTDLLLACEDVSIDQKNAWDGNTALHYASKRNMVYEAESILKRGADPDVRTINGWSPLNFATSYDYPHMVRLLLKTGKVNVNLNPLDGQPPLAVAAVERYQDIFDMLISHPDIDIIHVFACEYTMQNFDEIPTDWLHRLIVRMIEKITGQW